MSLQVYHGIFVFMRSALVEGSRAIFSQRKKYSQYSLTNSIGQVIEDYDSDVPEELSQFKARERGLKTHQPVSQGNFK